MAGSGQLSAAIPQIVGEVQRSATDDFVCLEILQHIPTPRCSFSSSKMKRVIHQLGSHAGTDCDKSTACRCWSKVNIFTWAEPDQEDKVIALLDPRADGVQYSAMLDDSATGYHYVWGRVGDEKGSREVMDGGESLQRRVPVNLTDISIDATSDEDTQEGETVLPPFLKVEVFEAKESGYGYDNDHSSDDEMSGAESDDDGLVGEETRKRGGIVLKRRKKRKRRRRPDSEPGMLYLPKHDAPRGCLTVYAASLHHLVSRVTNRGFSRFTALRMLKMKGVELSAELEAEFQQRSTQLSGVILLDDDDDGVSDGGDGDGDGDGGDGDGGDEAQASSSVLGDGGDEASPNTPQTQPTSTPLSDLDVPGLDNVAGLEPLVKGLQSSIQAAAHSWFVKQGLAAVNTIKGIPGAVDSFISAVGADGIMAEQVLRANFASMK